MSISWRLGIRDYVVFACSMHMPEVTSSVENGFLVDLSWVAFVALYVFL